MHDVYFNIGIFYAGYLPGKLLPFIIDKNPLSNCQILAFILGCCLQLEYHVWMFEVAVKGAVGVVLSFQIRHSLDDISISFEMSATLTVSRPTGWMQWTLCLFETATTSFHFVSKTGHVGQSPLWEWIEHECLGTVAWLGVMWHLPDLTCIQTARFTVPPIPSTTPFPWDVVKSAIWSFHLCLNREVGPPLKTLTFSMCGNFPRSCGKMHCMNTKCSIWCGLSHSKWQPYWKWCWCRSMRELWKWWPGYCANKLLVLLSELQSLHFLRNRLAKQLIGHHRISSMTPMKQLAFSLWMCGVGRYQAVFKLVKDRIYSVSQEYFFWSYYRRISTGSTARSPSCSVVQTRNQMMQLVPSRSRVPY